MLANLAWFAGGLVARIVGAEALVRGGSRLASRLGIRPIMVGLTVVSIGTSMPELAVGVVAATEGNGSLAVGNIAGTNMVNLLLILGLSALILPLAIQMQTLRFDLPVIAAAASLVPAHGLVLDSNLVRVDIPIMVVATLACVPIFITGRRVSRVEGGAMMVAYLAYLAFVLMTQI